MHALGNSRGRLGLALSALALAAVALLSGCDERLADRCYMDRDCDEPQICSNNGDRTHQGFCVDPPEPEEEEQVSLASRLGEVG